LNDETCSDDWDTDWPLNPPVPTVEVTEPKIVGTILGPNGRPLHTVVRPRPPFGYRR
jgi:hypothetical protein